MEEIALHILDIIQNSIKAQGTVIVTHINVFNDIITVKVEDNGLGMDENFLKNVEDPFTTSRTTRKVGLGISLFKQSALMAEGDFNIVSQKNSGTVVTASFKNSHIDRMPLGDITSTFIGLILSYDDIEFKLILESENGKFIFDTIEIKNTLNGVKMSEPAVINFIKEYLNDGMENIFGGILNEIIS